MNLEKLYESQNKLDKQIHSIVNLKEKTLLPEKILALQVKIGELANDTQCFKFWLSKKTMTERKVLEKYIQVLSMALSIGIEKNFTETEFPIKSIDSNLTNQFLNLFIDINDFMVCSSKDHYITLIEDILSLGLTFGFTEEDILETYNKVFIA
ncbi:Dimeric dUTPase, all-alpha-NTP-PPase (MazG) superfamily [Clostridium sp. USBA 49]|uniref:dUTP diphosphatase n=1 Tax=Clostridium TaxID=1485 RepID=UPI00099AF191|nr:MULTISPECIES: dUTP diphosphatase [Clostridium]SKA88859.1 Dimeric dUTPase, all-alpha-NTP-PPase (MazG) superfamily [Clostridium sp. USBA 49]